LSTTTVKTVQVTHEDEIVTLPHCQRGESQLRRETAVVDCLTLPTPPSSPTQSSMGPSEVSTLNDRSGTNVVGDPVILNSTLSSVKTNFVLLPERTDTTSPANQKYGLRSYTQKGDFKVEVTVGVCQTEEEVSADLSDDWMRVNHLSGKEAHKNFTQGWKEDVSSLPYSGLATPKGSDSSRQPFGKTFWERKTSEGYELKKV
jgi:hypothetical protein